MLLDAHAHLDRYLETRLDDVFASLEEHQILTLANAVDIPSYRHTKDLAEQSSLIIPGFGVHPWEAPLYVEDLGRIDPYLDEAPYIGEIGLDRRFVPEVEQYPAQKVVFEHQLDAASAQGKLVNVHSNGAERQVLDTLRSKGMERVVMHWYAGPLDVLEGLIAEGYWFTVGIELLLSDHIARVADAIPIERLLTETDNPGGSEWLTKTLEMPSVVLRVLDRLAAVKGVSVEELSEAINRNFAELVDGDERFAPWEDLIAQA